MGPVSNISSDMLGSGGSVFITPALYRFQAPRPLVTLHSVVRHKRSYLKQQISLIPPPEWPKNPTYRAGGSVTTWSANSGRMVPPHHSKRENKPCPNQLFLYEERYYGAIGRKRTRRRRGNYLAPIFKRTIGPAIPPFYRIRCGYFVTLPSQLLR